MNLNRGFVKQQDLVFALTFTLAFTFAFTTVAAISSRTSRRTGITSRRTSIASTTTFTTVATLRITAVTGKVTNNDTTIRPTLSVIDTGEKSTTGHSEKGYDTQNSKQTLVHDTSLD